MLKYLIGLKFKYLQFFRFSSHKSCETGNKNFSDFSCKYMGGPSSKYVTTLVSLVKIAIMEILCFWFVTWPLLCEFLGGIASRRVTTFPCLVTIGLVKVEINMEIVYLIIHVTSQAIEGLCNVFNRITFWMLFMNCHHLAKFGGHRYCGSRDIMFLVPHVI